MIDLILWAAAKADLVQFAKNYSLIERKGRVLDGDPESPTFGDVLVEGEWVERRGFEYTPWAGSGLFQTGGTGEGETYVPTYAAGFVYIIRLSGAVADEDVAEADETETGQASYSKLARWAKRNGVIGQMAGINYAEIDGVRVFRPSDVDTWLTARNLPGHIWSGGNIY